MKIIGEPQPPSGLSRLVFRLPILIYRANLGWMLGKRFLLLNHAGRKSGLQRKAVLEVVKHDADGEVYYIASGYGEKSDWYRNVMENPTVTFKVGKNLYHAKAERLPSEDAQEIILEYGRRHPSTLKGLARFMGYQIEATEQDYRALGRNLPIIALHYQSN
jgi:deazaflavin-dependent oxidoreductase (nitroreductase family)